MPIPATGLIFPEVDPMTYASYETWALRLNHAIEQRLAIGTAEPPAELSAREILLALAAEAAAVVGAIGRHVEAVQIDGNDRHGVLEGFVDQMVPHRTFSLVEYRYTLPSGREPGLRFHVNLECTPPQVELQLFEDRRRWRQDPASRNELSVPLRFELQGADLTWRAEAESAWAFATCTDWRSALCEALALPFRHLYDPMMSAC